MTDQSTQWFLMLWDNYPEITDKLPRPESELRFAPPRRWRFDLAWADQKLAVEIEGGGWVNGRHSRGRGFESDAEKYNAATLAGWRLLRFTPSMINADPRQVIETISTALGQKMTSY